MDISETVEDILLLFDKESRVFNKGTLDTTRVEFLRENPTLPVALYKKLFDMSLILIAQPCAPASPKMLIIVQTKEAWERDQRPVYPVMVHSGHEIVKCSCGEIILQCRCMDLNKTVRIVPNGCEKCKQNKVQKAQREQ